MKTKPIYLITAMTDDDMWSKNYRSRTFGYFHDKETAIEAVLANACDMHECLYIYIVIEEIYQGIHSIIEDKESQETWFRYDLEEYKWKQTEIRPSNFDGVVNFSIG